MCYGMRPDHLYVLSFVFFFFLLLLGYIVVYSSLSSSLFTAIVSATTPPLPLLRCSSFACARLLFKIASPSTGDLVSIKQLWPWLLSGIHTYIYIWAVVVVVVETLFRLSWKLTATNSSYWNSLIVCQILNRLQPSAAIGNQIRSLLRLVVLMKKKLWSSKDQKGKDGRLTIWRIAIRKSPSSSSKAEKQRSNAAGPAPTGAFHSALSSSDLLQPHHHHHLLQQQHPDGQRHIFQENTYKKITPCDVCSQVLRGITSLSSYKCDIELRYGIEVDFITFTLHTAIHLIYKKLVSYNWIECQSHSILTDKM